MNAAMDVRVIMLVIIAKRVEDNSWFLSGGRIIEINERTTVDLLIKDGEVVSQCGPVHRRSLLSRTGGGVDHTKIRAGRAATWRPRSSWLDSTEGPTRARRLRRPQPRARAACSARLV